VKLIFGSLLGRSVGFAGFTVSRFVFLSWGRRRNVVDFAASFPERGKGGFIFREPVHLAIIGALQGCFSSCSNGIVKVSGGCSVDINGEEVTIEMGPKILSGLGL